MSGKGGAGNNGIGKGSGGISGIPSGSKKMVQSLKEIVNNYSEQEIYATLKECNMDPNETVNRLLAQDPFHEVKSKKEKKKENKDTGDYKSRGANNISFITNRGSRGGAERRGGSTHYGSNESGHSHGKAVYKRENGVHAYAGTSSTTSGVVGHNLNRRPSSYSESVVAENKMPTVSLGDGISSSSQPSSGYQSAWLGVPGQISMADIVKMGRPQNKVRTMPNPSHQSVNEHWNRNHASEVPEMNNRTEVITSQDISPEDEWPPIENPSAASVSSILDAPADSELYANASNLPLDRTNQHMNSQIEAEAVEDGSVETHNTNYVGPPTSSRNIQDDNSGGSSLFDNDLYNDVNSYNDVKSYQPQKHAFEHNEAEEVISSVASNLQQLNLQNSDHEAPPEEDNPSVIIPNHLQVHTQDCSHLSFGSFGSGIGSAFSGPFASNALKNSLDETPEAANASSIGHSDNRSPEYYGDEHLRNATEGNIANSNNASAENYEASSNTRSEVLKQETPETAEGNQYAFPSSASVYGYENTQQLNPTSTHLQMTSQMQNLGPFSNVMQAYTNSLPSTLLASTVQSAREPDLQYSPFPVAQSSATKFTNTASSISVPTMSMPEALRAGTMSTPQPTQQTLPGSSVGSGPAVPPHLAMHPYSQHTLPLGHFANMIGYPFLPQNYAYMPSAFQQAFAGNSSYPQSLAAVLPQYKNSVSVTSLPHQSAAVASGYGFGSSTNIPGGNFPLNPPTAPAGTTVGYDDVLISQYKENNHLMSLQQAQNENSAMWVHGPGSRTMSAVPQSTYYSFQGQNQQAGGFRQGQQPPSQHFGGLGYPNFYHSQTGVSLDPQQQNPRDGSLSGSQVQPSKQTQLWQSNY
ncbi:hypothetical protein SLE2022_387950 [Rubroshorea leprosula]